MSTVARETRAGHPVASHEEWLRARTALLAREKEFTRLRDELNQARRDLPWERVEKEYVFETPAGRRTLGEVFEGRSQLLVYHFMFAPEAEQGCHGCSFWADSFDGWPIVHLRQRDVTFVAISRAPLSKLQAFQQRMGWSFPWLSSGEGDFNYDFGASFRPEEVQKRAGFYNYRVVPVGRDREGISAFYRDTDGAIYHTYSTYARGLDLLNTTYNYLDLVAKGRDEGDGPMTWLRHHDRYES